MSSEQSTEATQPYLHPEGRNILDALSEDQVKQLTTQVVNGFEADFESCSDYLEMQALYQRLYFMTDKPKDKPFDGASTESVPILTEAVQQFSSRALQNLFPGKVIVRCLPLGKTGPQMQSRMDRVSRHMSWQLTIKDRAYRRNKDALLARAALFGSYFTETYYDPIKKRIVVDNVSPSSLILQYNVETSELADIPRKTRIRYMPKLYADQLAVEGYFAEPPMPFRGDTNIPARQAQDDAIGMSETSSESELTFILEQHTFFDIDEDGIPEPYIVTFDRTQNKIIRVALRYETDPAGNPIANKAPIERFTHYGCVPNPAGFYCLGFGHLLGSINSGVNKMLRAGIDAAVLANAGNMSGFVSKSVSLGKGRVQMQIGNFKATNASPEDLSRGIWQPKFPGPNSALISLMQFLIARGDRLGTVTEALTGTSDKVLQPTTYEGLVEQGLQQFSAIYTRIADAMTDELMKIYDLNRKHMDPVESFALQSDENQLVSSDVARADYAPDMLILPISDPKQVTDKQKMQKAQMQWQFLMQNPLVMQSPQHLYAASVRMAKSMEIENIDEVIPNPGASQFPPIDDPMIENTILVQTGSIPMPIIPQQHQAHIEGHKLLLQDPQMGPSRLAILYDHISAHQRMMNMVPNAQNGQAATGTPGAISGLLEGTPAPIQPAGGMAPGGQPTTASTAPGPTGNPGLDNSMAGS